MLSSPTLLPPSAASRAAEVIGGMSVAVSGAKGAQRASRGPPGAQWSALAAVALLLALLGGLALTVRQMPAMEVRA